MQTVINIFNKKINPTYIGREKENIILNLLITSINILKCNVLIFFCLKSIEKVALLPKLSKLRDIY